VRKSLPFARLLVVGARVLPKEPGVEGIERIRDRRKLMEIYGRASAFVLPAVYDPMPHAAMEAMSLGVPVVVSTECGTAELIENGVNGFVFPSGQSGVLAEILVELLRDPKMVVSVGQGGAQAVRSRLTWERVADRIIEAVDEVVEEEKAKR